MISRGENFGNKRLERSLPGFSLSKTVYAPSLDIPRHDHEAAALCYVLQGSYEEFYGRRSAIHQAGGVVLHPAGEHHADRHGADEAALLIVEFEAEFVERLQERLTILDDTASRTGRRFQDLGMRLLGEMGRSDPASGLAIEGIVLETLAEAARAPEGTESRRPPWLDRVEAYLRDSPDAVSVAGVAKVAGVHPVHMARTFRQHTGCTIAGYSRRIRIESACTRLEGRASLAEIAADCGFSDQSHFTRVFRQAMGVSPGRYRRERRGALG